MAIKHDSLDTFVKEYGYVSVVDSKGTPKRVQSGDPHSLDLVENADKVFFQGRWYSRWEFEQIVEETQEKYSS